LTIYKFLLNYRQEFPEWLGRLNQGDPFPREDFLASRIVYYPGSGTDGHPVKLFGSTHCAHCFVHVDYMKTRSRLEEQLSNPRDRFRGYRTAVRLKLRGRDLVPHGWTAHIRSDEVPGDGLGFATVAAVPFGFFEVLELDESLDEKHGPVRLGILFLGADGIATYDALFCQSRKYPSPFAVVLQDHGFGGNYDRFGRGGLMERIARRCRVLPQLLLVAENTEAWQGFERIPGLNCDYGGMHNTPRVLCQRLG